MENLIFDNSKAIKAKDMKDKQVVFAPDIYENAEKSKLLFTNDLSESQTLGTGQIKYIKPRKGDQPFIIVQFSDLPDSIGFMLGDLKDAKPFDSKAPKALEEVKSGENLIGYKVNPNAKFAWDAENKDLLVKA